MFIHNLYGHSLESLGSCGLLSHSVLLWDSWDHEFYWHIFVLSLSLCFVRNIHTRILTCNQKSCVAVRVAPAVEVPVAWGIREGVGSVYVGTVITGTAAKSSNRFGEPSSRFRSRGRWLLTRLLLSVVALSTQTLEAQRTLWRARGRFSGYPSSRLCVGCCTFRML